MKTRKGNGEYMIRTCAIKKNGEVQYNLPLRALEQSDIAWYWVDFDEPTEEEWPLLKTEFRFHPLSIEDCLEFVQRPKMDFFDKYVFIILHGIQQHTLNAEELDFFIANHYVVTFHKKSLREIHNIWAKIEKDPSLQKGPMAVFHAVMDKMVDDYFPPIYHIEDRLNEIEDDTARYGGTGDLMDEVFDIRSELSKLRRTVMPMRELVYRIINSERMNQVSEQKIYFQDIYDHLLKLAELIEANRDLTSDIRDSYLSINSDRMNQVMMTLTVITTIFMPLTFIAGIYGMNFRHMPELTGPYSYYIVLGIMAGLAVIMTAVFQRKGWFRVNRKPRKKE
jgi:magnesium transporter